MVEAIVERTELVPIKNIIAFAEEIIDGIEGDWIKDVAERL